MMYLTVGDAEIWYEDRRAPGAERGAVVFVHAGTGSSESWAKQLEPFAEAGFRCVTYDQRGHRKSVVDAPQVDPADYARDLAALVEHLGLGRYAVVSMAFGGFVALEFAATAPAGLAVLVVANSVGALDEPHMRRMIESAWSEGILGLDAHELELSAAYRASDPGGVREWRRIHEEAQQGRAEAPMGFRNTPESLRAIRVPTHFISGDADLLAPVPVMRILAAHVEGSSFEVIAESGHASAWEQPDRFNRLVLGYLRVLSG